MQRIVAAARELGIHGDQILDVGNLARQDDPLAAQTERFGLRRAFECGRDERFTHHRVRVGRLAALRVVVHHPREKRLVEASPVDADAHRLVVSNRKLDERRELRIALAALADVARIDAELRERLCTRRVFGQELVAVEMKVADQRDRAPDVVETIPDFGNSGGGLGRVDGDAHELRTRVRERAHLRDGRRDIGGVGVRHLLHNDRRATADGDAADHDAPTFPSRDARPLDRRPHCNDTRATLPRVYGDRSSACPRNVTPTSRALPSESSSGGSAVTVCVIPLPPVICSTTRPFASLTSAHDVPLKVSTSGASVAGGGAGSGAAAALAAFPALASLGSAFGVDNTVTFAAAALAGVEVGAGAAAEVSATGFGDAVALAAFVGATASFVAAPGVAVCGRSSDVSADR